MSFTIPIEASKEPYGDVPGKPHKFFNGQKRLSAIVAGTAESAGPRMIGLARRGTSSVAALGVVTFLTAIFMSTMQSRQDMATVSDLTSRMKSVCVGRFLVDIPAEARVSLRLASVDGFEITRLAEPAEAFQSRLRDRESRLHATPNMQGQKNIESSTVVQSNGFSGKTLVHSRRRGYSIESERRAYFDTISAGGYVHKAGVTYAFVANTYDPGQTHVLPMLLARFTDRAGNEIPAEPGFRIDGGMIRDPHEMDTGLAPQAGDAPVQSSLSDEAMLALWDKVSSSIRLCPTAPSELGRAELPLAMRGLTAFAGPVGALHLAARQ